MTNTFHGTSYPNRSQMLQAIAGEWLWDFSNADTVADDARECVAEWDLGDVTADEMAAAMRAWLETHARDAAGHWIDMDAAANLMDDDLREELAFSAMYDNDPTGFLREYAKRHAAKFGEDFAPYAGGAW